MQSKRLGRQGVGDPTKRNHLANFAKESNPALTTLSKPKHTKYEIGQRQQNAVQYTSEGDPAQENTQQRDTQIEAMF